MGNGKRMTRNILALSGLAAIWFSGIPSPGLSAEVPLAEPKTVLSKNGKIDSPLTTVFGTVQIPAPNNPRQIQVRAYGLEPPEPNHPRKTHPLLPGPTFVFHPGDLLRLRLHNYMNRANNPRLNRFENNIPSAGPGKADDIAESVPHEINIPNNADITNLHVHGLHVDPKQDNVTLLILPEDSDPSSLVPELQRFVPTINRWWTRPYQYKIPADHLPGTYWYHAHKHGATSTQVENGMAGTLLMLPTHDDENVVPGLWNDDPTKTHDRVLVLQEITDFGVRQGVGGGRGKRLQATGQSTAPFTTINGQIRPTLQLPAGQLERWRFIIAGANHTVSSDIWVGKIVPNLPANLQATLQSITTAADAATYAGNNPTKTFPAAATLNCQAIPGAVKLIALDGITMWQSRNVTPLTPAMGSAGNRLELLIQPDASAQGTGPYRVYQNYPLLLDDLAAAYPALFGQEAGDAAGFRFTALSGGALSNGSPAYAAVDATSKSPLPPNQFNSDTYQLGANYQGLQVKWAVVDAAGKPTGNPTTGMSIAPLIAGLKNTTTNGVDAVIRAQDLARNPLGWQPLPDANGAGPLTQGVLMELDINGIAVGPKMPSDADLNKAMSSLSPAGTGSRLKRVNQQGQLVPGIPAYVAPLPAKVDGRQAVIFDRGQYTFNYVDKSTRQTLAFRQFWLNGRQFDVDDYQGNPDADALIQKPIVNVVPDLGSYVPDDGSAPQGWTNQVNGNTFITNPGYYVPIVQSNGVYNYNYSQPSNLNNKAVSGLDESTPPVSTTAEEWLLVNNSDLFHPFHIHISPFFVTEIGQLNYDSTKPSGQQWSFKTMTLADKGDQSKPFSWVVGNWWDVITLPPHGYVKIKTWINVPSQFPVDKRNPDSDLVVKDNSNVYGSWVLHCHILRHEDRGMMTMVNTVPKAFSLTGKWIDNTGNNHQIVDTRGGLAIIDQNPTANYIGTFNQGIGNPLLSQPWLGSMSPATGTLSFCVTQDDQSMVLSNGQMWGRSAPPSMTPASAPLNLTGTWTDSSGHQASIVDTAGDLVFRPISPVWWAAGTGTWGPTTPTVTYAGTQHLNNLAGQNQQLTFCVTADLKTIVFGNGIKWTRP